MNINNLIIAKGIASIWVGKFENKIDKIVLFGSRVRDNYKEDSDFDFVILGDFDDEPVLPYRATKLYMEVAGCEHAMDLIVVTQKEFDTSFIFR